MIRLHQINPACRSPAAFFPPAAAHGDARGWAATADPRAAPVRSEGPAVVQLQPMCGEGAAASASAAAEDPELSVAASVRQKDVVMMSSRLRGRCKALPTNYWRHQESDVNVLFKAHFDLGRTGGCSRFDCYSFAAI